MPIQFMPTEEQSMLRDGIRRWLAARDVREAEDSDKAWAYGAEQGWLMAGLPEEAGGLGGTAYDFAVVAEELGRGLVRAPFVEVGMVTGRLLATLAPERAAMVALGEARPLLAHDEPGARGDPLWVQTQARIQGQGAGEAWRLTGVKSAVIGAPLADSFIVSAQMGDKGIALFDVAADAVTVERFTSIDGRPAARLTLEGAAATLLAGPRAAGPALAEALDHALVLEAAEAVGAMQRVLELTRDYLLTRKQYGQLIGQFQALRHRLADMFIEVEQSRSILLRGLQSLTSDQPAARAAMAAAVKARVAQAGLFTGAQGIQLHGGIGVTDEYPVGHYYKRLLAFAHRHGSEAIQVERYAKLTM